jgi:hypothetical protein
LRRPGVTYGKVCTPLLHPLQDKIWLTDTAVGTVDVPLEKLPLLNKSKEDNWFMSDRGGVLAGLEIFHTMHCLDIVRQYTYKDEYDYNDNPTFQDDAEFVRMVSSKVF